MADTSAVLTVVLGEEHRGAVIEASAGAELVTPASLPWEIGNALVNGVRRERLTEEQAVQAVASFEQIALRLEEVPLAEAVRTAGEEEIYAYDAYMLVLAHRHGAFLLSTDLRLRNVARGRGLRVRPEALPGDERYA